MELKGRPIVTGHSWCSVEASKFVQRELREIPNKFRDFLKESGLRDTLLSSSKELIDLAEGKQFDFYGKNVFATFHFKDLYTNILYTNI